MAWFQVETNYRTFAIEAAGIGDAIDRALNLMVERIAANISAPSSPCLLRLRWRREVRRGPRQGPRTWRDGRGH
jgi:hypothetical protein